MFWTNHAARLILLALVVISTRAVFADDGFEVDRDDEIWCEIEALRTEIRHLRGRQVDDGLDATRRVEVRRVINDALADADMRTNRAGRPWNEIASADGDFTLQADVIMQYDWVLNSSRSEPTRYGFSLDTLWLSLGGTVFGPDWSYAVCAAVGSNGAFNPEYAYAQYQFDDGLFVQAGILSEYFSIEQAINPNEQLGTSLSFVAGQFDAGQPEGILVGRQFERWRFWSTLSNGWGQSFIDPLENQRVGVMARVEFKPFGDWNSLYMFNPYPGLVDRGLLVGFGGSFDWGDYATGTGPAVSGDATRATADISWQQSGIGLMAAAYYQDEPVSQADGGRRWAAVAQGAFFPVSTWDVYARGEWGAVENGSRSDFAMATIGASWIPAGDSRLKVVLEVVRSWGSTADWSVDGDIGILAADGDQTIFRTQLQFAF
jgi:hypothetical protein